MDKDLIQEITNYWNAQPCNIKHGTSPVGSAEFWNEVTQRRYFIEPHSRDFAGFHSWRGKRVLEIGCGIGTDAEQFARHGAKYVGIDISEESIKLCRARFEVFGLDGEFHTMDGADRQSLLDLGQFDLVWSCGVLHHYPDIDKMISNIHRVLPIGGEFRFLVYAKNSWKYAMIQKGLDQFEAQAGCPYAKAYTKEEIYDLLEGKFTVERIRQSHCFMYNVEEYKKGRYKLEPWFECMPEAMREAIREYLGWHLLVKAKKV